MLNHQILYSDEEVQQLVAKAHQKGVDQGFELAFRGVLQLAADKREQERLFIQNWQGMCESREGDECGHC